MGVEILRKRCIEKLFPDEKIIVTEHFDVHQDWFVPIPGFFIMASAKKKESISEFDKEELVEYGKLLQLLRKGMRDALGIEEVFFFQNEATEHRLFHTWIFPWYPWMNKFGPKNIASVPVIVEHAKEQMLSENDFQAVRDAVGKMREYLAKN